MDVSKPILKVFGSSWVNGTLRLIRPGAQIHVGIWPPNRKLDIETALGNNERVLGFECGNLNVDGNIYIVASDRDRAATYSILLSEEGDDDYAALDLTGDVVIVGSLFVDGTGPLYLGENVIKAPEAVFRVDGVKQPAPSPFSSVMFTTSLGAEKPYIVTRLFQPQVQQPQWSASMWVRFHGQRRPYAAIFGSLDGNFGVVRLHSGNLLASAGTVTSDTGLVNVATKTRIVTEQWFHIAFVVDSLNFALFVNGVRAVAGAHRLQLRRSLPLLFGAMNSARGPALGSDCDLDEIAVWQNRSLSQAEIARLADAGTTNLLLPTWRSNLSMWLRLETAGPSLEPIQILQDVSGNNNHATLVSTQARPNLNRLFGNTTKRSSIQ
jgi:hypothetical protein